MQNYLLTILILLPAAGALAVGFYGLAPSRRDEHYRWIAFVVSAVTFLVSLLLLRGDGAAGQFHFVQDVNWIGAIGARYHVGVDGISLWLVLLTTLLVPVSILSSWRAVGKRTPSSSPNASTSMANGRR